MEVKERERKPRHREIQKCRRADCIQRNQEQNRDETDKIQHKYTVYRRENRNCIEEQTEPVFLNVYGAPELIPRNEFRQPM